MRRRPPVADSAPVPVALRRRRVDAAPARPCVIAGAATGAGPTSSPAVAPHGRRQRRSTVARRRRCGDAGGHVVVLCATWRAGGCGGRRCATGRRPTGHRRLARCADLPEPATSSSTPPASTASTASPLDAVLRAPGVDRLVLGGFGAEATVDCTLRSANDRGYECLVAHRRRAPRSTPTPAPRALVQRHDVGRHLRRPRHQRPTVAAARSRSTATPHRPRPPRHHDHGIVDADPYPWPYDGAIDPARTALVNIDWQIDFCGPGGYVDTMGYDLNLTRAGLEPTAQGARRGPRRRAGLVMHTREGHRPDLSDCPPNKLWRSKRIGAGIGDAGPVRAHPRARRARLGDRARGGADRRRARSSTSRARARSTPPTSTCCCARRGITHLVFTGITTDVCVHTTMREANDRGYECLLLDATAPAPPTTATTRPRSRW